MDLARDDPDFHPYNAFIFSPCRNTDSLAQKSGDRLKVTTHSSTFDLSHISCKVQPKHYINLGIEQLKNCNILTAVTLK